MSFRGSTYIFIVPFPQKKSGFMDSEAFCRNKFAEKWRVDIVAPAFSNLLESSFLDDFLVASSYGFGLAET